MKNQHHIRHIKMVLLKETGDQSLIWPDAYSLRPNFLKHFGHIQPVMAVVYIRNRCYNQRLKKIRYQAFTNQEHNLQNIHIFGTVCFPYVHAGEKEIGCQRGKGDLCRV